MASVWKYLVVVSLAYFQRSESRYSLHLEDTLYLPFEYTPIPRYEFNRNAGGSVRYDPTYNFAYVAGRDLIHVISLEDILHLDNVYHIHEPGFQFTDIVLCGEYVLAPADNTVDRDDGKLFIFKKYNDVSQEMPILQVIDLEHNPSHIAVSENCQKVLVSLEGEAWEDNGVLRDPEGGVSIFMFPSSDLGVKPSHKVLDFTAFNADAADYIQRGVRHVYPNSTFSQDLEPEGITLRYDEKVAYVSLQENNAIAEIDVSDFSSARVVELFPLGYKSWHDLLMDPSDWDQDIRMQNWRVYGLYQPDAVHYFEVDNTGYLLCANEGAAKEYPSWSEAKRGQDFMLQNLVHEGVSQAMKDALLTTSNLGRLEFSIVNGKEADGKYSDFYSFGARSFSIRRADNPSAIVYDSGDLTGRHHQNLAPAMFNTDPSQGTLTVLQTRDTRSDNRGAEPESVAVGTVDGEKLFFIGNERSSSVEVYSVRHGVTNPVFHNITYGTQFIEVGKTWETLYTEHNTGDLDPEGLEFIEARDSPVLEPLLLVSGSVSGTLSIFKVSKIDEIEDDLLANKVNELYSLADNSSDELLSIEEHAALVMDGDVDGNHRIDKDEFYTDFHQKVGLLESKLDFVFNELDVDNNRYLNSFDTNALFYLSDRDATGFLTRDQFSREWKRILNENIDLS